MSKEKSPEEIEREEQLDQLRESNPDALPDKPKKEPAKE